MKDTPFDHTLERLRTALRSPLPGPAAQCRMNPEGASPRSGEVFHPGSCKEGAVLVALYPLNHEPAVVLTRRPDFLPDHPGQISLPGGRRDAGEALVDTALRECHEELGVVPSSIEVLGPLSPLYIAVSNYRVFPFVGALARRPEFRTNPSEVSELIEVPVGHLFSPTSLGSERRILRGRFRSIPFYALNGHQVWGATAMILAEFLALLEDPIPHRGVTES